jgi:hypothetical protein
MITSMDQRVQQNITSWHNLTLPRSWLLRVISDTNRDIQQVPYGALLSKFIVLMSALLDLLVKMENDRSGISIHN